MHAIFEHIKPVVGVLTCVCAIAYIKWRRMTQNIIETQSSTTIRKNNSHTPIDFARNNNNKEAVRLIICLFASILVH